MSNQSVTARALECRNASIILLAETMARNVDISGKRFTLHGCRFFILKYLEYVIVWSVNQSPSLVCIILEDFASNFVLDSCITHAKISHLSASRQQVVFALFVPSCQQVWNELLTIYNNFVDIMTCCKVVAITVVTILLQPCVINLVTFWLYHDCIRLVRTTL
jgi:hypothetical protein